MKKGLLLLFALALLLAPLGALADLDVVENYYVTVDVRQDASADITYQVEWRVLNDQKEGPLEWVKIGIANKNAEDFKALTSNIKRLRVISDGGSFARVDLDRKYYKDEVITFAFSLHQKNLCTVDQSTGEIQFKFGPGWFQDLKVQNFILRWKADGVSRASGDPKTLDGYYYWQGALNKGEKGVVTIVYPKGALSPATYASKEEDDDAAGFYVMIAMVIVVVLIVVLINARGGYRGGFGGPGGPIIIGGGHVHRGGSCASSCACVSSCACACACACAGGGRAGCSAKNFYGARVKADALYRALNEKDAE